MKRNAMIETTLKSSLANTQFREGYFTSIILLANAHDSTMLDTHLL